MVRAALVSQRAPSGTAVAENRAAPGCLEAALATNPPAVAPMTPTGTASNTAQSPWGSPVHGRRAETGDLVRDRTFARGLLRGGQTQHAPPWVRFHHRGLAHPAHLRAPDQLHRRSPEKARLGWSTMARTFGVRTARSG